MQSSSQYCSAMSHCEYGPSQASFAAISPFGEHAGSSSNFLMVEQLKGKSSSDGVASGQTSRSSGESSISLLESGCSELLQL
jgi:hypothetical protein